MMVLSVVAGGMILLMVVRPIQKISRGLHRLNAEQGNSYRRFQVTATMN
jgi:hypothetical protein